MCGAFELVLTEIGQRVPGAHAAAAIKVKSLIPTHTYVEMYMDMWTYLHANMKTQQMHSRVNGMSQLRVL